ncbi:cephalosporin hydroxylase family protein [Synechococcus sp. MIT S9452]|uniref:cephalosporin hydroxylase family protein n=1 Tax=Synechococcus sp. MIT S9452 TaxID=3082546 RepID=UPI0039A5DE9C
MGLSFSFDGDASIIRCNDEELSLSDPRAFQILSDAWLRSGWDTKYVYGFSWLGRPIIQLPEDMIRIQEVIYDLQPDVIIETGVAHGGSLIFYASLCTAIGKGRVVGIDIEIRNHNRLAIEEHRLSPLIKLIEGSSVDENIFSQVKSMVSASDKVLVLLDSNHTKSHVLAELNLYSQLVTSGSYIVACDGIMKQVTGAPRTNKDWEWDNPLSAIADFLETNPSFKLEEPFRPFNEGSIAERVTYWPNAYLRKS